MKKAKNTKEKKEEKVLDASGKTLGRLASMAAVILSGKDNPSYERHIYSGSPLKIVNVRKIRITEEKLESITHKKYSGYPGGLKELSGTEVAEKKGYKELVKHAVHQMLPGNKLRREMMKNLTIEE